MAMRRRTKGSEYRTISARICDEAYNGLIDFAFDKRLNVSEACEELLLKALGKTPSKVEA